jgi:hypothetical protein
VARQGWSKFPEKLGFEPLSHRRTWCDKNRNAAMRWAVLWHRPARDGSFCRQPERFQAKWNPVRAKKTLYSKELEVKAWTTKP